MRRIFKIAVFLAFGIVLLAVVLLFMLDYRSNYPYVSFRSFSTVKQFLAFKKNIGKSYLYDWTNGIRPFRSGGRVGFDLIDPKEPKAIEFRKRAELDAALEGARTQFDKLVRLREWTHSRIWPLLLSPSVMSKEAKDGFSLLVGVREKARMVCGQAADLYAQAVGSVGLIGREVRGNGHILLEAWSPEHKKWVVMDPLFNTHYEKEGVPLSFVELMSLFYSMGQPDPYHFYVWKLIREVTGVSGNGEQVLQKILRTIRRIYAEKGVTLKGGPRTLPLHLRPQELKEIFSDIFGDMTPSAFADYAIALRADYLVHQYPTWHLRNYNHMWNYLYWTGSLKRQPTSAYQVSNDLKDFYWQPRGPDAGQ